MSFAEKAKHEIKTVGIVTAYFLVGFSFVIFLLELLLTEYEIAFAGLSKAIIAALVLGKVVVVLRSFRFLKACSDSAGWVDVLYRSFIYGVGTFLVVAAERIFDAWREVGEPGEALQHVLESGDAHHIAAVTILVGGLLVGFNTLDLLIRRLGKEAVLAVVVSAPRDPP